MPQYCTVAQLVSFLDARLLAEVSSDTDADAVVDGTNAIITNALVSASDDVESYARLGGRYRTAKLAELYAASNKLLIRITAHRAAWYLWGRRGGDFPPAIESMGKAAERALEQLRDGLQIFGDDAAESAGATELSLVTQSQRREMGLASSSNFFPPRNERVV